jgi:hypothetical protein
MVNSQSAPGQETAPLPGKLQPGAGSSSSVAAEHSSEGTAACEVRLIMEIQDEVLISLACVECQTSPEMRMHMLRRLQQGVHLAAGSMQMQAAASDAPAIAPGKNLTKKRARDAMEVSQQRAKACMLYQHEQALPPLNLSKHHRARRKATPVSDHGTKACEEK